MITYINYLELFNRWSVKQYVFDCFYMTLDLNILLTACIFA